MGYMAIVSSADSENIYVVCGDAIKCLSSTTDVKTFKFPEDDATKDCSEEHGEGQPDVEEQASGRTLGLCVSTSGRLVAALNDRKAACVWRAADGATVGCWRTARKASCLTFAPDEEVLLVADKSGDVYKCQLSSASTKPQLILGHISMVLDMCVTADGRHLVTCDRDEKIRLTCYPNTWTIDAYCLGHSEFVAALCLTSSGLLVSGGGDMMLRLWDPATGRQLAHAPVAADGNDSLEDAQKVAVTAVVALESEHDTLLVAQVHSWSQMPVFSVSGHSVTPLPPLRLPAAPWAVAAAAGRLYVLGPGLGTAGPLAVFAAAADGDRLRPLPDGPLAAAAATLTPQLQGTFEVAQQVSWLFKQWFDNVSTYMSKKEERLKMEKKEAQVIPAKKRKTSE